MNIRENRQEQLDAAAGKKFPTVKEDLHSLLDQKFHATLLTLPTLGIATFMILPIIFMIMVSTNYLID